ncbi:cytochrome c-type biogenesis protein [uncultured Tateyamaria sp.]|uniref:cytochrome c-type biogenesis protein n=1 Tax=uncultured Tateyamaria sp. TaxID=455651 RepID=UPI0026334F08|nr:cytochrome c-type biogenesis protein [uncultured Tateyamaria sp.]
MAVLIVSLSTTVALALDPSEMLDDPVQEAQARELDHAMRCVVCQSESVASSNAQWAIDTRRVIREQVAAGKTNDEIIDFFVERYGEFVLMNPRPSGSNWLLWAAGPLMFLTALGVGIGYVRARSKAPQPIQTGLSEDEAKRLREILDE